MSTHAAFAALALLLLAGDPLSFLAPNIRLTAAERRAVDDGAIVSRTLDAGRGQVGVFAMSRIEVPPQTLLDHARKIEDLKRSSFVKAIRRFSDPPRIEDLKELELSPRDLQGAAQCRPGDCAFKFTAPEIALLQAPSASYPATAEVLTQAFRQAVLARVHAYLSGDLTGIGEIVNRSQPACLSRVFDELLKASLPLADAPCADDWLRDPSAVARRVESFLYWSQEMYGGRPVILVTHVGLIAPSAPSDPAIVIGKQILATRYMTGGISMTAIVPDPSSGAAYLVYVNRTGVDVLGGLLGPIKRAVLESRLRSELPTIIGALRGRLEKTAGTR